MNVHQQPAATTIGADNLPLGENLQLLGNEVEVVRKAGRQAISSFLDSHNCFSVLRASGKVVVFDIRIPIQLAFYALVEHDMQAAPLWDPVQCQFVGLLKVTDFIDTLRLYKQLKADVDGLATRSIADMIQDPIISERVQLMYGFPCADSTTSLKQACKLLLAHSLSSSYSISNEEPKGTNNAGDGSTKSGCGVSVPRLDFLPIVMPEDMRVLACITYTNILEHLVTHFRETRRLFDDTIYDLQIGTYHDKLVTVSPDETLAAALELMSEHNLSAIPVVDKKQHDASTGCTTYGGNRMIGVYSRSDITFLTRATDANDAVKNLDSKLGDVLEQQRTDVTTPDAMHSCSTTHTLQSIFEYFAQLRFNRLFVMNESEQLVGVVSARDLVEYFMID